MTISWRPVERCPQCGYVLDYFETFSSYGAHCGSCGWKNEKDVFIGAHENAAHVESARASKSTAETERK